MNVGEFLEKLGNYLFSTASTFTPSHALSPTLRAGEMWQREEKSTSLPELIKWSSTYS
jgi:hypothetical protein